ncbi:MAG: hypothetical protein LBR52_06050 [Prevotellaceae bacterium]|jgi:hypothetical protein|nr:hypothetical protein [Prevotellaceae bacterium]
MYIANPIYDSIFKYMLEDNKVAKVFISAIIGEEILELDFNPQEYSTEIASASKGSLTVCRFDFSAKIRTENGFKTVIIELQKAKYSSDLMRFRRYLGVSYQNKDNSYDEKQEKARQIYCIYFLDYGADLPARPVLRVDYKMEDISTGDEFPATGEFVSGLHHRSWIVQIKQLKQRRRNDLEKLLGIFDQSNITDTNHILNVEEDSFPEEFQQIIRRLRKAAEDPGKRRSMDLEDDIVKELQDLERKIEEKDKTIEEKDKTIEENQKKLAEKDCEIAKLKLLYGIK